MRPLCRYSLAGFVGLALLLGSAGPASATWSVIGVDPESGQVGVAMASCIAASALGDEGQVLLPVILVPGESAGVVQGAVDIDVIMKARNQLDLQRPPDELIGAMIDGDQAASVRQYGFVTLLTDEPNRTAQFTGPDVAAVAGNREGPIVAVQGTGLVSSEVLDATFDGFNQTVADGGDLPEALVAALGAGSEQGGDIQCPDQTALFAQLVVARAFDEPANPEILLTTLVDYGDGQNPVVLLKQAFEQGESGWIDYGTRPPGGIPRLLVLAIGLTMLVTAGVVLRIGMGSPSARRAPTSNKQPRN